MMALVYCFCFLRGYSSVGERLLCKQDVGGSNPPTSTTPNFAFRSFYGALGGIRTHDPLLRRQLLYPLSYQGAPHYFTSDRRVGGR